jgi:hypothetical protein
MAIPDQLLPKLNCSGGVTTLGTAWEALGILTTKQRHLINQVPRSLNDFEKSQVEGDCIMTNHSAASKTSALLWSATGTVALMFCLSAGAYAQEQQDQQGQQQDQQQAQQADQQQPPPDRPTKPTYAPQDADRPPYIHDNRSMRNAPEPPSQPAQAVQPSQPVPGALTVPAGTVLIIRTTDFLSTDKNQIGDQFTAVLDQPLVVNGWVVARRGQVLVGKVKDVKKAGRIKGTSEMGVELTDITIVDGRQLPILTELWKGSGGTSHGQDAATIGTTTGVGALIGSTADWGRGAAIGAGAGAAAGIAAVLLTRGRPTVVEPETLLNFRLVDPLKIDTTQSQQAFLPVTQQDFYGGRMEHRGPRRVAGYPGPYGYPCGYYAPCYGYPYVGFYGAYGYGRGYYGRRGFR